MATSPVRPASDRPEAGAFAEVWGDTVRLDDLARAIAIGGIVSLACFLGASHLLRLVVDRPDIARAYAMLAGLGGCLLSGTICALLFRPKREILEHAVDPSWRRAVLDHLLAEHASPGALADLPQKTVQELKQLGLYDLFAIHDEQATRTERIES